MKFKFRLSDQLTINGLFWLIGMLIVWFATYNYIALLGAFIASIHWEVKVEK